MKILRYKIILGAGMLVIMGMAAPVATGQKWSLDSCISYAHEHNINVKQRQVNSLEAEYGVTEAKDRFLPTVSAGAQQSFDFGRGLTSENTYANRNTQSFGWSANMQLPIFQGLAGVRRLSYAKANLRAALEEIAAAKDDITLNIISQYLQVLYNKEILQVAQDQANLSELELNRRKELLDAGKIPELDLLEAESQLANDRVTAVTAQGDLELSLSQLAQMLQLPYDPEFDILPLVEEERPLPTVDEVYNNALSFNHTLRASQLNAEAARRNVALAKSGYLPTLSFNAGLNSSYYKVSGMGNPSFSHQMRDNFSKGLGITLSVPIFDAFSTRNSVRRANAAVLTATLQTDNARLELYNAIVQAYVRATSAREKCTAGAIAEKAAEEAFKAMQHKYNYGRATATEFEQSKSAWFKATAELIQSRYESILRARILHFYNTPQ